ncbi:MAG: FG-GAP repeat protein [Candidatus Marinimicrobia bacterium]|nr:FG-GAP repeat protein [Candidatus Neomarinimicrobiota bacterium]
MNRYFIKFVSTPTIMVSLAWLSPVFILSAQITDGTVSSFQKISDTAGNFTAILDNSDRFGVSTAALGDLDGDGIADIAVGADYDDDGGTQRGAVYVLFMNANGTVKSDQKISDTEGDFTAILDDEDLFGRSVAALGDLDNDGVTDLVVGAYGDDDGGVLRGAVYVLFMNSNGTVKSFQKISDTAGSFTATLDDGDQFGTSVAALGDLDGDTVPDMAVGVLGDGDGGTEHGAVYILFMNTNGTVKSYQKISDTEGNFTAILDDNDQYGTSITALGDLDNDGVTDLAVGAIGDDDGGESRGTVYVLFMNTDGTVKSHQKISDTAGTFAAPLVNSGKFGISVAGLTDLDGDSVLDLAVGAFQDDDGGTDRGAVYVLFMNTDGTVKSYQKISDTAGNFTASLETADNFGYSVSTTGDLDGDGLVELIVGARFDDDGGTDRGAVYILFLDSLGIVAYYPFDGNANDETANSFDGTVFGANLTADRFGNDSSAYSFDGIDDYITVGSGLVGNDQSVSISIWTRSATGANPVDQEYLYGISSSTGAEWRTQLGPNGSIQADFGGLIGIIGINVPAADYFDGTWQHIGVVWDKSTDSLRLFINGVHKNTGYTGSLGTFITSDPLNFGNTSNNGSSSAGNSFVDGDIDDIRIYNYPLSSGEIVSLFLEGPPSSPTNLTATAGFQQISLHWSPNSENDFLRYRIYGGTASAPTTIVDSTTGGDLNDTTATIAGLTNGTTYYYRITAVDSAGNESGWSNEVSAAPSNEFTGSQVTLASNVATHTGDIVISNAGTLTDLEVRVTMDLSGDGLTAFSLSLISPSGTSVNLFPTSTLNGSALFSTLFDDEGAALVNTGSAPYIGTYKPMNSLTAFDGESITGTWQLVVYKNNSYSGTFSWDLITESDNTTPSTPPDYGITYSGSTVTLASNVATHTGDIVISDAGTLTDLEVGVTMDLSGDGLNAFSLTLISPSGTSVNLFPTSTLSGSAIFSTLFDDEGTAFISTGAAPYIGNYKPMNSLSAFDGESVTGTWQLVVFKNNSYSGSFSWDLLIETYESQPPAPPQNLVALSADQQITLSWSANTEPDFLRYRIYGGTSPNPITLVDSTADGAGVTSKAIAGLVNDTRYYYRITAFDVSGDESEYSNEVSAIPHVGTPPPFPPQNSLFISDGTVKGVQKISATSGVFAATLDDYDDFGFSLALLGDLDGDGISDIAVGNPQDDDGGPFRGSVFILFLQADGTVKSYQKISATMGGFNGALDDGDAFGFSVAALGDLDGDGFPDLAVGARADGDGGTTKGAIYVLFLNTNGSVKGFQKISATEGNFNATLDVDDRFGSSVALIGDLDGDGVFDIAVGADHDDDGGNNRGAVYVLFMNADGTVKSNQKISSLAGNFNASLDDNDLFGQSVSALGDLDGDGILDMAVGAWSDDDGGVGRGAIYVLFLNTNGTVKSFQKISNTVGNFSASLDNDDLFGGSLALLGDINGDGITDMAVGARGDDDGGDDRGAVYILFLQAKGTVMSHAKISSTSGGFNAGLDNADRFGQSISILGDLDGDGVTDLVAGSNEDDDGAIDAGALHILFLNRDITPPIAPMGIIATSGSQQITISWSALSEVDLVQYRIFRDIISPATILVDSIVGSPPSTTYIDTGLTNGQKYYYRITAVDLANNESDYSNEFLATPYGGPIWHVATTGSDSIGNGSQSNPFKTLRYSIARTNPGDTILVAPGTYTGIGNKKLEIDNGLGDNIVIMSSHGPSLTVVDLENDGRFIEFYNGAGAVQVKGFTIINGFTTGSFGDGAAFRIHKNTEVSIEYCLIRNCSSDNTYGGAISCDESSPTIRNCTIINNLAGGNSASAITAWADAHPTIVNTIIRGNDPIQLHATGISTILVDYSDIEGGWAGIGNINIDPLFTDPANNDYSLQWQSPLLDAGSPASPLDADGTRADIGAIYFDQRDPESPQISILSAMTDTLFTQDTVVVSWSATDNVSVSSVNIVLQHELSVLDTVGMDVDPSQSYSLIVPDRLSTSTRIIVTAVDWKDNAASDTSASFVIADDIPPTLLSIDLDSGFIVPEYEQLGISATARDNIAVDSLWAIFDNGSTVRVPLTGTFNDSSYSGMVAVPAGVTDSARVVVFAQDASGNLDSLRSKYISILDNSPPVIASLDAASTLQIGSQVLLSWSAEDNVRVSASDLAYQITGAGAWQTIGTGIADSSYLWTIPNDPTDNLNLRLIAWDAVGLSDTLYSQRHAIVIAYPKLVTAPNPINSIFWRSPSLTFRFDQILDTTLHAGSAFQVSALFTTNLQMGATYSEDLRSITMGFEQPLVSADTVTISLIADSIANLYGYQFDGNANGIPEGSPTDDITYTYSVLPYADFDSSQTIDFDDLTRFTTAWYAKDYALELGPSSGTVPHLLMAPDTTFNGRDLITFIRMWDWYTEFAAPLGKVIADLTGPTPQLAMEGEELVISLDLAKDVTAVHVQLTYPKDRVEVDWVALDSTSFGTRLLRRWPEQGIIEADYAFPQGEVENFTISALVSINGRDPVTLEVYAEVVAKGGIRFGGAERTIEAKPVPKQFALHNNYPNPFNPRTTILFDVPTSTNATLIVYDLTGREVVRLVDGLVDAGYHQKIWDGLSSRGRKVASGIYIARLSTPRYSKSVKMLLLK